MRWEERDLAERLGVLGLRTPETRVYAHLVAEGPRKAGEVAAAVGLHRPEGYRVLHGLARRGPSPRPSRGRAGSRRCRWGGPSPR